jgi:hypothetical protein
MRSPSLTQAAAGLSARLRSVRNDWRQGRLHGYPLCCIAVFCWDSLWELPPSMTRMVVQGVERIDSTCEWVPCGIFHHGGSVLSLRQRVMTIARYWLLTLAPGSSIWRPPCPKLAPPFAPWQRMAADPLWDEGKAVGALERAWAELDGRR